MIATFKSRLRRSALGTAVIAGHRAVTSPAEFLAVLSDLKRTRVEFRQVLNRPVAPRSRPKKALFVELGNQIYGLKLHAMLAAGMTLEGHEACILTTRLSPWATAYFRAAGQRQIAFWETFALSEAEIAAAELDAGAYDIPCATMGAIKCWRYREVQIGTQILASLSRAIFDSLPNLKDPSIQAHLSRILRQTLIFVRQAEAALRALAPDLVAVIEANYAFGGALVDVAISRDLDVVQFTQPARDDALVCRRLTRETRRMHPGSVSQATLDRFAVKPWTEKEESALGYEFGNRYGGQWFLQRRNQPDVEEMSETQVRRLFNSVRKRPLVGIFSPVLWDANLFYGEDLFEDFGDWLVETVKAAAANDSVQWLVKLHPANLWKRSVENVQGELSDLRLLKSRVGPLPDHVRILPPDTRVSTRSLFNILAYAVTVRGTVGMELPCFGVPVITAGTGRYSGLGFTIDSTSRSEYLARLANLRTVPTQTSAQTHLAKWHALLAFRARQWKMRTFEAQFPAKANASSWDQNLRLKRGQPTVCDDLRQWARWAADSQAIDYLDLDEIS